MAAPSHSSTPPIPSPTHGGPTPAPPAQASVSAREEAMAASFYKATDLPRSPVSTQFTPPDAAYDIASTARISPSPQGGKGGLAERLKERKQEIEGKKTAQPTGWLYAPATSHISRFMLVVGESISHIQVVFKGPDNKGEVAEYMYSFIDRGTATRVFNQLRSSPHPYGMVLYPKVIKAGVPYAPMAI